MKLKMLLKLKQIYRTSYKRKQLSTAQTMMNNNL